MKRLAALVILLLGVALAQQNVTVTWMTGNVGRDVEFARSMAQRYMDLNPHTIGGQQFNVTVNVIPGPESATDRLALYLQFFQVRSTEVDIFEIDVIWPGDLAEHLADLYQFEGFREAAPAFFQSIIENNTVDGRLVGIPYFTDAGILYYRTDLLEKYGFDGPPATWTELTEMARVIQEGERAAGNRDFWGFVWQGNAYEGLTCNVLEWFYSYNAGQFVEPEGIITVNNPQAIMALEKAAGWVGTISPPGVTGFQEEDARAIWQAGNAAFMRNWPYAFSLGQAEGSVIRGLFNVAPLPAGDVEGGRPAATLGGWQLGVGAYSLNPAVAADVALFITNYEGQLRRALELSQFPTIAAVYENPTLLESEVAWLAELLPVFQNSVARPSTISAPQYGEVSRLVFSATHDVLTGREDAETALAILELDLEAILGLPTGQP